MEFVMKPNVFISYSRREVSFANSLVDDLEDRDYKVWLDYRDLVPGTTWADQIDKGIAVSDVIVLVVSKASMASEYVEMEWKEVLKQKKRVILAIFEAVDLPDELECLEWVDFRGSYKKALTELIRQINQAEEEEHRAPETGFKIPFVVWLAICLSGFVALFSLGAFWTIFIPLLLIPLPIQILRRNFKFTQVQSMLIMLPFALLMTTLFVSDEDFDLVFSLVYGSVPFVLALIYTLVYFVSYYQLIFLLPVPLLISDVQKVITNTVPVELNKELKKLAVATLLFSLSFGIGLML